MSSYLFIPSCAIPHLETTDSFEDCQIWRVVVSRGASLLRKASAQLTGICSRFCVFILFGFSCYCWQPGSSPLQSQMESWKLEGKKESPIEQDLESSKCGAGKPSQEKRLCESTPELVSFCSAPLQWGDPLKKP